MFSSLSEAQYDVVHGGAPLALDDVTDLVLGLEYEQFLVPVVGQRCVDGTIRFSPRCLPSFRTQPPTSLNPTSWFRFDFGSSFA
ncbi:hypothetical protein ACVIGB_010083 [Bradyrhizobium sp. USDA 4341]